MPRQRVLSDATYLGQFCLSVSNAVFSPPPRPLADCCRTLDCDFVDGLAFELIGAGCHSCCDCGRLISEAMLWERDRLALPNADNVQQDRPAAPATLRSHLGAVRGALPVVDGWGLLGLFASW
jgi:hypothetical protein